MDNGSGDGDSCNDYNFCVDSFDKVVGTGIKSNDRCSDVSYECVGSYDASFLTRFPLSNSNRNNIRLDSDGRNCFGLYDWGDHL